MHMVGKPLTSGNEVQLIGHGYPNPVITGSHLARTRWQSGLHGPITAWGESGTQSGAYTEHSRKRSSAEQPDWIRGA